MIGIGAVLIRSGCRTGSKSRLASTCTVRRRAPEHVAKGHEADGAAVARTAPVVSQHELAACG